MKPKSLIESVVLEMLTQAEECTVAAICDRLREGSSSLGSRLVSLDAPIRVTAKLQDMRLMGKLQVRRVGGVAFWSLTKRRTEMEAAK